MQRSLRLASLFTATIALASSSAMAQQLGTVFIDFDGEPGTPQGTVTALDAARFAQAPGALFTTAQLRDAIRDIVRADYLGASINIVDTLPDTGNFTRLVVGDEGSVEPTTLGIANEIDFRNKRKAPVGSRVDNIVSVLAKAHTPALPPGSTTYTLGQAAQLVGNTASHELGHVLGLVHSDVASTFQTNGGNPAGALAVRNRELMAATTSATFAFNDAFFGQYSKTKLEIDKGINVQPETGAAVFTAATADDPARAGDAGATIATATALTFESNRVTALGTLAAGDTRDVFKFDGAAGQRVTAEIFSNILRSAIGGRIADPVTTVFDLIDAAGNVVPGVTQYDRDTDFENNGSGDAGSDHLFLYFALPADGTYGIRVDAAGADPTGQYELLVLVPEPTTLMAAASLGLLTLRRRIA